MVTTWGNICLSRKQDSSWEPLSIELWMLEEEYWHDMTTTIEYDLWLMTLVYWCLAPLSTRCLNLDLSTHLWKQSNEMMEWYVFALSPWFSIKWICRKLLQITSKHHFFQHTKHIIYSSTKNPAEWIHQKFLVPKMEDSLNLIAGLIWR